MTWAVVAPDDYEHDFYLCFCDSEEKAKAIAAKFDRYPAGYLVRECELWEPEDIVPRPPCWRVFVTTKDHEPQVDRSPGHGVVHKSELADWSRAYRNSDCAVGQARSYVSEERAIELARQALADFCAR